LSAINVNSKIDKKGGLSYLSWSWSWSEIKKACPDANYTIYENADGLFYHTDGKTAWVKTGVTIEGVEHIEYLPVMNFSNKSVTLDKVTSTDVNKTIQRSITKASARHGLGMYIYAGEDLPEEETISKVNAKAEAVSKAKTEAVSKAKVEGKPKKDVVTHITLDIGDDNWVNVLSYIGRNKEKGLATIVKTLSTKYKIRTEVKEGISKAISDAK